MLDFYKDYQTLAFSRRGKVLTVTMNRPEVRNAANMVMHNELSRVFHDIARDPETAVVILTGAGDAFSAGGDIRAMQQKIEDRTLWVDTVCEARNIFNGMVDLEKPVIARLRGPAAGLGATLVVYCDIVIADETASISDPHVRVGLAAGDGGALMWPLLVGFLRAKQFLFTGDAINAQDALQMGLVNDVVPESELDDRVNALADRLAGGATLAIGWTKKAINQTLKLLAQSTMEAGLGLETLSQMTDDHASAVSAFAAKQKPEFKGR